MPSQCFTRHIRQCYASRKVAFNKVSINKFERLLTYKAYCIDLEGWWDKIFRFCRSNSRLDPIRQFPDAQTSLVRPFSLSSFTDLLDLLQPRLTHATGNRRKIKSALMARDERPAAIVSVARYRFHVRQSLLGSRGEERRGQFANKRGRRLSRELQASLLLLKLRSLVRRHHSNKKCRRTGELGIQG